MQRFRPSAVAQALACTAVLSLFLFALTPLAHARGDDEIEPGIEVMPRYSPGSGASAHGTANTNCAGVACDTVWVGYSPTGPGGTFRGVGAGGTWNFDSGTAGTDSSQGWRRWPMHYRSGVANPAIQRPAWGLDYGNMVNEGDTDLWNARTVAGRKFVKTGIAGMWHSDTMVGVKLNVNNVGEPSSTPIAGNRSAWCGLRESGNTAAQDALTGNYINGDLINTDFGPTGSSPEFPGYVNLLDQMLYKDFSVASGSGYVGQPQSSRPAAPRLAQDAVRADAPPGDRAPTALDLIPVRRGDARADPLTPRRMENS